MSSKWKNEQSFLEWLAAKESKHSIELIVSNVAHSDSLLWQERHILRCLCKYTGSRLDRNSGMPACHDPSHGGFYMAEGASYIRAGLPPRIVSGDCLVLSLFTDLLIVTFISARACSMSDVR